MYWEKVEESKVEMDSPVECHNCGGHIQFDATWMDQCESRKANCPYCGSQNSFVEESKEPEHQAVFSVGPVDDNGKCDMSKLKERAIEGMCRFTHPTEEMFGNGKTYQGVLYINPTWQHVLNEATKMIQHTKDSHHIFLEGVQFTRNRTNGMGTYANYEFVMGS